MRVDGRLCSPLGWSGEVVVCVGSSCLSPLPLPAHACRAGDGAQLSVVWAGSELAACVSVG
jgi:hypothetical protein